MKNQLSKLKKNLDEDLLKEIDNENEEEDLSRSKSLGRFGIK